MKNMVARFPDQLTEALEIAKNITLQKHDSSIRSVYISGLGGSGIGGTFVQEFSRTVSKFPIVVGKGYSAPAWVNRYSLVICSSYSGNTEETLAVFEQVLSSGAKIVCVASGGKLIELAKKHNLDYVQLPTGWSSPRACLGYSVVAQLGVLVAARVLPTKVISQVAAAQLLVEKEQDALQKQAKTIAKSLLGKTPVIYVGDHMEAVAIRWRQQINENAKLLCWHHVLPEMNHNELVGWHDKRPDLAVIWLRNRDDFGRTAIRTNITKTIVGKYAKDQVEIMSKGRSLIERAFYFVHLGDWVSVALAELRQVDPIEINVIDYLKGELSKV